MFTKEELDEIKKSINIVEFIGRYVNLQKAGSSYRGLCPFHSDNDPSFYVHPQRGFFHCFGCGEKGDIITFYQKIENLSFSEAVKRLADYAGIPVEVDTAESEYDRYTAILSRLATIYNRELRENNHDILKYLEEKRKITPNTISEFQLGYSPDERTFPQSLQSKLRADEKSLLQFGVLLRRGTSFKDRFAGRLMIPIDNESGRVVGFGGRIMVADQGPKYMNSSESKYFQKNRLLFNLSRAKAAIKQLNYVVIAEGYFDVISLFEAGVSNAVGLLGTALTENHLRVLGNYTRNLLFFLDSDAAGQAATLRSVDIAEKMDFTTAVVMMRDYKDPADLFVMEGAKAIKEVLAVAIPGAAFRVEFYSRKLDLSVPQGRKHLIEYLRPYVVSFRNSGNLATVESTMAALSEKTGYSERELQSALRSVGSRNTAKELTNGVILKLKDHIRIYLQHSALRETVVKQLELMEESRDLKELLKGMKRGLELEELLDLVEESIGRELIDLASICIDYETAQRILRTTGEYANRRLVEEEMAEIDRKLPNVKDEGAKRALLVRRIELRRLLDRKMKGGD
ncbi:MULTISPECIES: DNA primase [unclassified Mesotoga]|uniref:DNA primase n=1 Tax=unclassified Mesotoga TaxID=1184398 RepID=UPI000EF1B1B1|nr:MULTISPECIES: DNA primase [unclassified Mesotoga]MDD3681810.1 DNA primase [Mesotoga sp.]RLL85580.1 DNA primase [Mesotoga sp. BH458_6_3_2_1]